MTLFSIVLFSMLLQAPAPVPAPAVTSPLGPDRAVFHVSANGREIGTERFDISPSAEGMRATAEIQINVEGAGKLVETSTLVLRRGIEPSSYERIMKSPKRASATLTFTGEKAQAQYKRPDGDVQDMEFYVPKNVVILDTNFFHHYTFLVRQYDFTRGGTQHFSVLVPQEASPGMIRVESAGTEGNLRKLVARTDALEIQIWSDDAGRIQKMAVPAASVEIVRAAK